MYVSGKIDGNIGHTETPFWLGLKDSFSIICVDPNIASMQGTHLEAGQGENETPDNVW